MYLLRNKIFKCLFCGIAFMIIASGLLNPDSMADELVYDAYAWFVNTDGNNAVLFNQDDSALLVVTGNGCSGLADIVLNETDSVDAIIYAGSQIPESEAESLIDALSPTWVYAAGEYSFAHESEGAFAIGAFSAALYNTGSGTLGVYVSYEDNALFVADACADLSAFKGNAELYSLDLLSLSADSGVSDEFYALVNPEYCILQGKDWQSQYTALVQAGTDSASLYAASDEAAGLTAWLDGRVHLTGNTYASDVYDARAGSVTSEDYDINDYPDKDTFEVAVEVMNGFWGSGEQRTQALTEYGYDPAKIQSLVDRLYDPSIGVFCACIFEMNGYGDQIEPQLLGTGQTVQQPDDPISDQAAFTGWYADEALTVQFDFNTPVEENVIIYAGWEKKEEPQPDIPKETVPVMFTVSFDAGEGIAPESQQVEEGSTAAKPDDPAASGKVFEGWRINSEEGESYKFNNPVTENLTLYGAWRDALYTVNFDANGGSGTMDCISALTSADIVMPVSTFSRDGWSFVSWNSQPAGNGDSFSAGQKYTPIAPEDGAVVTLYAQWAKSLEMLEGSGQEWSGTQGLQFVTNGNMEGFKGVYIDETELTPEAYTAWANASGMYITVGEAMLGTLAPGTHELKAVYDDGICSASFTCTETAPVKTGDIGPGSAFLVMLAAVFILAAVIWYFTGKRKCGRH